jgi:hypothetical protein
MAGVFVSYRVGDSEAYAILIDGELSRRIGDQNVFRASRSIPVGADFHTEIVTRLAECDVLVAIIGPQWLTDATGRNRINEEGDWVRRDLPDDLKRLARNQYLRLHYRSADADLPRLIAAVLDCAVGDVTDDLVVSIHFRGDITAVHSAVSKAFVEVDVTANQYRMEDRDQEELLIVIRAEVSKMTILGVWIAQLRAGLERSMDRDRNPLRNGHRAGANTKQVKRGEETGPSGPGRQRSGHRLRPLSDRCRAGRPVCRAGGLPRGDCGGPPAWTRVPGWSTPLAVFEGSKPRSKIINVGGNGTVIDTFNGRDLNLGMVHYGEGTASRPRVSMGVTV